MPPFPKNWAPFSSTISLSTETMSAFIPASGLSAVSGASVQRESMLTPLRAQQRSVQTTPARSAPSMVSYPYTGSGYGCCGIPYANNKVGQFFLKTETEDIVTTAASVPIFSTLVSLLQQTGLDYELQKGGPFTVFAPSDDAFAALLEPHSFSTFSALLRPENIDEVRRILAYHVIPGRVSSAGVNGKITATTFSGDDVTVMTYNRSITAGSATVIKPDIQCTNGIIHVIGSVLTPPSYVTPEIEPKPQFLPDSLATDYYGKMLTPRQALGLDQAPAGGGLVRY